MAANEPTRRRYTRTELEAGWRYLGPDDLTDGLRARLDAMLADADRRRSEQAA
jgi:hypothetical protein